MKLAMGVDHFGPLVLTLAYTGIRYGEAVALRRTNVDLENRRIRIVRSATAVAGRGVVETDTKNHLARSVPVPDFLNEKVITLVGNKGPGELVFPGRRGGHLTSKEFRWVFDRAAAVAGLGGLPRHSLRHTAASLAISTGANIKVVQRMLGHKTATPTLDLYGHLFPDDLDAVAAGMKRGAIAAADQLRTA